MKKRRVLRGKSVPHYAALEPKGKGLMVASEKPFVFTHVDGRLVEQPVDEDMEEEEKTGGSAVMLWLVDLYAASQAAGVLSL